MLIDKYILLWYRDNLVNKIRIRDSEILLTLLLNLTYKQINIFEKVTSLISDVLDCFLNQCYWNICDNSRSHCAIQELKYTACLMAYHNMAGQAHKSNSIPLSFSVVNSAVIPDARKSIYTLGV